MSAARHPPVPVRVDGLGVYGIASGTAVHRTPAPTSAFDGSAITRPLPPVSRPPSGPAAVALPQLPATAAELADLAAGSLREPARCRTLLGSPAHVAAVCALVERLELALRAADARSEMLEQDLAVARSAADTTGRLLRQARIDLIDTRCAAAHVADISINEVARSHHYERENADLRRALAHAGAAAPLARAFERATIAITGRSYLEVIDIMDADELAEREVEASTRRAWEAEMRDAPADDGLGTIVIDVDGAM